MAEHLPPPDTPGALYWIATVFAAIGAGIGGAFIRRKPKDTSGPSWTIIHELLKGVQAAMLKLESDVNGLLQAANPVKIGEMRNDLHDLRNRLSQIAVQVELMVSEDHELKRERVRLWNRIEDHEARVSVLEDRGSVKSSGRKMRTPPEQ